MDGPNDPVAARRAQAARLAKAGQRAGYLVLGLAVVVFGLGVATGFTDAIVTTVVAALAVASAVLIPAIIVGFGARAAERDERPLRSRPSGD